MTIFKSKILGSLCGLSLLCALCVACSDANEYENANTVPVSFGTNEHPAEIGNSTWVRQAGISTNAYGEDVQGFVESITFTADSAIVKMDKGNYSGTLYADESGEYVYTYAASDGTVSIKAMKEDAKGNKSLTEIFRGTVVATTPNKMVICHYGDVPLQTYLVRQ